MTSPPSDEPSLFIVAASSKFARGRVERVVVKGLDTLRGSPSAEIAALADSLRQGDGLLHAWSIRPSGNLDRAWNAMRPGDWLVFYQMGFISAAAKVAHREDSPALAAAIWGDHEAEELRRVIAFDESYATWAAIWPHREILGARFLGFRRMSDERQQALRSKYGSVDLFIRRLILTQRSPRDRNG